MRIRHGHYWEGVLTISGKGKWKIGHGKSETPWYAYRRLFHVHGSGGRGALKIMALMPSMDAGSLENVVLPQSMAGVGNMRFKDCSRLKESGCREGVAKS